MQILSSNKKFPGNLQNISLMLKRNVSSFGDRIVFREKIQEGKYEGISWADFYKNIENIAFNLRRLGFSKGDKMVLFSPNRLEMLEMELAVMASGGIAVPIFAYFKKETAELLIGHSDARFLAVSGKVQLDNLSSDSASNPNATTSSLEHIFVFDAIQHEHFPNLVPFKELLKEKPDKTEVLNFDMPEDEICLNIYTSGTMGTPKCVQLTHQNILSQQAALNLIWDIGECDRFLSYLPWHHSFGGIFELFTALYHGATYHLESSFGRDPTMIIENWKLVKPTVFFSVPKVYQAIVEQARGDREVEDLLFNSGLKFIFTAAAALPERLSNEFEERGIPVIEGWGLTETSPCCTLTDPALKRQTGVVGKPIPGVSICIGAEDEILVKGPNVMVGYYKNDEANAGIFTEDGWFRTGDVGEITETGLKLISRKDRIFKLSNGEKVVPTDLEKLIELKCHYVSYAIVAGSGEEYPVALIFPNKKMLDNPDYEVSPFDGCFCPRNLNELSKCLTGCLHDANCGIKQKFAKIKAAAIVDDELSLEKNTLTPSMKVAPKIVLEKYKKQLFNLYEGKVPSEEDVYVIELKTNNLIGRKIEQD